VMGQYTAKSSRLGLEFRATAAALAATLTLSMTLPATALPIPATEQPVVAKLDKHQHKATNPAPKPHDSKANADQVTEETIQIDIGDDAGSKAFGNYTGPPKIPCTVWSAPNPKVAILAIHGFGMHKGAYNSFARQMVPEGVAVYAIDVRGFGSWVARGVNRIDFNGTLTDIGASLKEMRRMHPGVPIIVLGESMGGAIALRAASMYPDLVDGLVSSVPAGDRFDSADSKIGIVSHVLAHGFNAPIDVGPAVAGSATKKE
jgi:pimeloyl-ACP methyl ester carboxylesterase